MKAPSKERNYNPAKFKKNIGAYLDPYLAKGGPHEMAICKKCHAIYHKKRWFFDEAVYKENINKKGAQKVLCPACQKIKDKYPSGFLTLKGDFIKEKGNREEILNLIKNEETLAKGINPLERIIDIKKTTAEITVTTTNEKLAQKIGRAIYKAHKGKIKYNWSHDVKLLRATWEK
ncbi:MAG: BCAM0308 family protein [Nitrospirota bacterium]